jgi:hypothetical protein
MAEGKQGSSSGKGQSSSSGSGGSSSGSGSSQSGAQKKTDEALKSERSGGSGSSGSSGKSSSGSSGEGNVKQETLGKDPSQDDIRTRDDATSATGEDSPGVEKDPSGVLAPAENAPGPEQPDKPEIRAVDMRPRIEPKDRATYVGAVHKRHPDVDVPEEFQVYGNGDGERDMEEVEIDAEGVDVFQIVVTNHNAVFRFDGQAYVLDGEQTRAFMMDARGALTNVVT